MTRFFKYIDEFKLLKFEYYPSYAMQSLNALHLIDESFNWESASISILRNEESTFSCKFTWDKVSYIFMANKLKEDTWDIQYDLTGTKQEDRIAYSQLKSRQLPNYVFSAAFKCIKELINNKHPKYITFSTYDEKLMTFYDHMKSEFKSKLSMQFIKSNKFKDEEGNNVMAWLYEVEYND